MRQWNTDLMEWLLPREQRDAIRRLDDAHYMKEEIRKPCDVCLALEALRTLLTAVEELEAAE